MKKIVVLISGSGSNLQAILNACQQGKIAAQVTAVFSNQAEAYGLIRGQQAGAETHFLDPTGFANRQEYDAKLMEKIDFYQPDVIVLAGFMRILSPEFVRHYQGKMLNIHPSLLPLYPGLNTHQRAMESGDQEHGASVHFVTEELDGGPVVLQAKVPIFSDDDVDALRARVQHQEHFIYPLAVKWLVEERLSMRGNDAYLDGSILDEQGYAMDESA